MQQAARPAEFPKVRGLSRSGLFKRSHCRSLCRETCPQPTSPEHPYVANSPSPNLEELELRTALVAPSLTNPPSGLHFGQATPAARESEQRVRAPRHRISRKKRWLGHPEVSSIGGPVIHSLSDAWGHRRFAPRVGGALPKKRRDFWRPDAFSIRNPRPPTEKAPRLSNSTHRALPPPT
jgi:hypothetical protein